MRSAPTMDRWRQMKIIFTSFEFKDSKKHLSFEIVEKPYKSKEFCQFFNGHRSRSSIKRWNSVSFSWFFTPSWVNIFEILLNQLSVKRNYIKGCDEEITERNGILTNSDFDGNPCTKTFNNEPGRQGPSSYRIFFEKFNVRCVHFWTIF